MQWIGVALFLFFNYSQHMVVRQMARTREGKEDGRYGIFHGGWFELISCPHFFFEICIYVSFALLIFDGVVYRYMLLFVVTNQILAGLMNHRWYLENFKTYPQNRKAIIPFLV